MTDIPDIVVRALNKMASENMTVGHFENEVRKCCESDPDTAHDDDCLVFHALAALRAVGVKVSEGEG